MSEPSSSSSQQQPSPTLQQTPVASDEKFFAALAYIGFLFLLTLIVKPKSDYCKFHARQSMVLFLMTFIVLMILVTMQSIGSLLTLALFAIYILALYRAYKGDRWNIPLVSKLAGKIDIEKIYGKTGLAVANLGDLKEKATDLAKQTGEAVKSLGNQGNQEDAKSETSSSSQQQPPPPTTGN